MNKSSPRYIRSKHAAEIACCGGKLAKNDHIFQPAVLKTNEVNLLYRRNI